MHLMHSIFREQLDDFIVIFLDDILVYSRDLVSHVAHVRKTFAILRHHSLYARHRNVNSLNLVYIIWAMWSMNMDSLLTQPKYKEWLSGRYQRMCRKFAVFWD